MWRDIFSDNGSKVRVCPATVSPRFFKQACSTSFTTYIMCRRDVKSCVCDVCDMTRSYVWLETVDWMVHDSFVCVTWLIRMCDMTHWYVWHDSFTCVTWLVHMWDMTHLYVWHDSFTCVTWLIHMCDMTHSYVWHDSFMFVTWLIHVCDMTHSLCILCADAIRSPMCVWHDWFICVTWNGR